MSFVVNFINFWYDFVVGDDWTVAVGVVLALIIGAFLARNHVSAWWWMPVVVALILTGSLLRATRASNSH